MDARDLQPAERNWVAQSRVLLPIFRGNALESKGRFADAAAAWQLPVPTPGDGVAAENLSGVLLYAQVMIDGNLARHACNTGSVARGIEYAAHASQVAREYVRPSDRGTNDSLEWTTEIAAECDIRAHDGPGAVALARGLRDAALRHFERDPGNYRGRLMMADRDELYASALAEAKDYARAADFYRDGMHVLEAVPEIAASPRGQLLLGVIHAGLGTIGRVLPDAVPDACQHNREAGRILTEFQTRHGGIEIGARPVLSDVRSSASLCGH